MVKQVRRFDGRPPGLQVAHERKGRCRKHSSISTHIYYGIPMFRTETVEVSSLTVVIRCLNPFETKRRPGPKNPASNCTTISSRADQFLHLSSALHRAEIRH